MATENKWAERFWSIVTLVAAVAGGGACVKVILGSDPAPTSPQPAAVQHAPTMPSPCYQPPPAKPTCGTPAKW